MKMAYLFYLKKRMKYAHCVTLFLGAVSISASPQNYLELENINILACKEKPTSGIYQYYDCDPFCDPFEWNTLDTLKKQENKGNQPPSRVYGKWVFRPFTPVTGVQIPLGTPYQ
jgi:hypothetical protein